MLCGSSEDSVSTGCQESFGGLGLGGVVSCRLQTLAVLVPSMVAAAAVLLVPTSVMSCMS
jgi:hypothetical protein